MNVNKTDILGIARYGGSPSSRLLDNFGNKSCQSIEYLEAFVQALSEKMGSDFDSKNEDSIDTNTHLERHVFHTTSPIKNHNRNHYIAPDC